MALQAYVNGSGTTVTLSFGTAYGSPLVTSAPGPAPTVRVNGGTAQAVGLAVWCDPSKEMTPAPHVTYVLPAKVKAGDSVTISVAAGAVATSAGPNAAATDMPCVNYAGTSVLPQAPASGRTMKVGFMAGGAFYTPFPLYANLLMCGTNGWTSDTDHASVTGDWNDQTGMPLRAGDWGRIVVAINTTPELPTGYPIVPPGKFTLRYKSLTDAMLYANGTFPADDPAQRKTINGWNYKVYPNIPAAAGSSCPAVSVAITTTGDPNAAVELYDKNVPDPTNPPKFHPLALSKMAGASHHRFKDSWDVDAGCPIGSRTDFLPEGYSGINDTKMTAGRVGVVKFENYQNAPYARPGVIDYAVKCTTAAPHGLTPGQVCTFHFPSDQLDKSYLLFQMADGTTTPMYLQGPMCYPLDATSFVIINTYMGKPIATTIPPAGSVLVRKRRGMPVEDSADLCNAVPGMDCWASIPHAASDDCVTAVFTTLAQRLAAGKKVWLEYSNEPWNWQGAYPQYHHFEVMGNEYALTRQAAGDPSWLKANGGDPRAYFYIMRAGQVRALARAAWQAAGRDPGEVSLLMGGWLTSPNSTSQYVQYCDRMDTQGRRPTDPGYTGPIPFEALAVAPYQSSWPIGDTLAAAQYNALTLEQVMDVDDAFMHHVRATSYGDWLKGHADAIKASSRPATKLISYEGGFKQLGLGGSEPSKSARMVAASLHPRIQGQVYAHLSMCDENGMLVYTQNALSGIFGTEGVTQIAGPYLGLAQSPGYGDGSDGQPDNRPYLADATTGLVKVGIDIAPGGTPLVSPYGLALDRWNSTSGRTPSSGGRRRVSRTKSARRVRIRGGR